MLKLTDNFNSQFITKLDNYCRRFVKEGTYTWGICAKQNYQIQVNPAVEGQDPAHYRFHILHENGAFNVGSISDKDGNDVAGAPNLTINANDRVFWDNDTPDDVPDNPVFWVVGDNGQSDYFNSQELGPEDGFCHGFVTPGAHPYSVTGAHTMTGTVIVSPPPNPGGPPQPLILVSVSDGLAPVPNPVTRPGEDGILIDSTVLWNIVAGTKIVIKSSG